MFNSNAIDFNEIYYDSQLNISEKLAKINVILIKHASNFTQATFAESQKYTNDLELIEIGLNKILREFGQLSYDNCMD